MVDMKIRASDMLVTAERVDVVEFRLAKTVRVEESQRHELRAVEGDGLVQSLTSQSAIKIKSNTRKMNDDAEGILRYTLVAHGPLLESFQ